MAPSCDLVIATERSRFGLPNINVGIPAILEATILPRAMSIFAVKEMCFMGECWDAREAERKGLLNLVVPPERLCNEVLSWADKLAEKSPLALTTQKDIINKWMTADLQTTIDFSINTVTMNWSTLDQKEDMSASLEKRKAKFTGELS